jgi:basic membrane protein A and related proteins
MERRRTTGLGLAAAIGLGALASACGSTSTTSSSTAAPAASPSSATTPAAATTAAGSSSATAAPASGPIKAAWIYVGPKNDGGWSQAHEAGRLYVQKTLGAKVVTTYKENVPEGPQVTQVIEDLIRDGNKIIFGTSFGYQDPMAAEAAKHPDVKFEQATGTKTSANMGEYYGAGEDTIYLSGMAAGAASKKGVVGYVAPFAIPEVIRHTNAFALGVQAINPKATVKVVWTNSWFAPDKEKKAAQSLVSAGADVIGQNVDSPAAGQAAETLGVPWVGYDSDAQKFAPKSWLTAAVYDWGPYYAKQIQAVADGTWKSGFYYGSIADGFTALAPFGPGVSADAKAKIEAKLAAFKAGSFNEFTGPITDQSGKVQIPQGAKPSVTDLYAMSYFVKGVDGNPKG